MDLRKIKKLRELKKKYQYDLAVVGDKIGNDQEKLEVLLGHNFISEMTEKINEMFEIYEGDHDIDRFRLFILQNIATISANIICQEKKDLKLFDFFSKMFLDSIEKNILQDQENE